MDALGRRWDFLRPWCAPVRGLVVLRHRVAQTHVPSLPYKAIKMQLPYREEEPTSAELRALQDALVLLAMVAHVDFTAYKYVLTAHYELDLDGHANYTDEEDFRQARFVFRLNHADPWAVLHGLFADLDAPPSAHFAMAARKIAGYRDFNVSNMDTLEIPVVLVVETMSSGTTYHVERTYRALQALQTRHNGRRLAVNMAALARNGSSFDCAFVIEPLDMEMLGEYLTPETAELVEEMVGTRDELPLYRLALMPKIEDELHTDPAHAVQTLGKMFTRMLCPSDRPKDKLPAIGEIHMTWTVSNPAPVARLCSALAETRTTDTLTLSLEEDEKMSVR